MNWRLFRYIFFELVPVFIIGILLFILIILMFEALRLTEFILQHGVSLSSVFQIMGLMSTSFLPALVPMSLLFAVLLTYGRLNQDAELTAASAIGVSFSSLALPAICFSLICAAVSLQLNLNIAPWGSHKLELMIKQIASQKAAASIKSGVFSQGFFDMVIYANQVASQSGQLEQVFIYDERDAGSPTTIIAKSGQLVSKSDATGQFALLRLNNGSIHRTRGEQSKIDFQSYDIELASFADTKEHEVSLQAFSSQRLREQIADQTTTPKGLFRAKAELSKRYALAFACLIFAFVGITFSLHRTDRRSGRGGGLAVSVFVVVFYWIIFVYSESAARNGTLPSIFGPWIPNLIFAGVSAYQMYAHRKGT